MDIGILVMDTSNYRLSDETKPTFLTRDEELLVERLVDGELQNQEREDLIHLLDERVDGWRFLALTFLEEQSLCQALKGIKEEKCFNQDSSARTLPKKLPKRLPLRVSLWMAIGIFVVCGIVSWNKGNFEGEIAPNEGNKSVILVQQTPQLPPERKLYPMQTENSTATLPITQASGQSIILNSPSQGLSNIVTTFEDSNLDELPSLEAPLAPMEIISQLNDNSELDYLDTRRDIYKFPLQGGKTLILPIDTYHTRTGNVW